MASRVLFVGLGGTGGVVLSRVRARLAARVRESNWPGAFPEKAWSFLHIDVPMNSDIGSRLSDAETGDALALGMSDFKGSEYFGLAARGDTYQIKDAAVRAHFGGHESSALVGWRPPDENTINVPLEYGAGQWRMVGSIVGLSSRDRIEQSLLTAANGLNQDGAKAEVQRLTAHFERAEMDGGVKAHAPLVMIVSSMVGGAGAGLYLDVANIARKLFDTAAVGFLVTADGFNTERIGSFSVANSWALLSEIQHMVAAETPGPVGVPERLKYPAAGAAKATFVVGARNASMHLGGQGAVEEIVGEALANVATDEAARLDLINFAITNNTSESDSLEYLGEHGVFRSLGFGRLELGRARFGRYASDRLLGLVGRRLRSAHLVRLQDEQADAAIRRTAGELRFVAAERAGLFELDIDDRNNDQILDALRPKKFDSHTARAALGFLGADANEAGDVVFRLSKWIEERSRNDRGDWDAQLSQRLDEWRDDVEKSFREEMHRLVAEYGAPVAARVLELMSEDLKTAATQLRNVASEYETNGSQGHVPAHFQRILGGYAGALSEDLRGRLTAQASKILRLRFAGRSRSVAAEACDAAREFLVDPARASLESLSYVLFERGGEWEARLKALPRDGEFAAYVPAPYEVMIEEVSEFPGVFEDLVVQSVGDGDGQRLGSYDAITLSVTEILAGDWLSVEGSWSPGTVGSVNGVPRTIRLRTDLSMDSVEELVRSWRDRPHTALTEYLEQGLGSYVRAGKSQLQEFGAAFGRVLDVARPLGATNNLVHTIHKKATLKMAMGALPFQNDDDAQEVTNDVVSSRGLVDEISLKWSVAESDSVEIGTTEGTYQAVCFETLMGPIRKAWDSATAGMVERRSTKLGHSTEKFGENRHTVPLTMAVPMSVDAQKAAYLGLLIGHVTGQVDAKNRRVKDPRMDEWVTFPAQSYWYQYRYAKSGFVEIIDDIKVAYLEASRNGGDLAPLRSYEIIISEIGYPGQPNVRIDRLRALTQEQRDRIREIAAGQRRLEPSAPNLNRKEWSTDWWEFWHIASQALDQLERELDEAESDLVRLDPTTPDDGVM